VKLGGDEILVVFLETDEKTEEGIAKRSEKKLLFSPLGLPLKYSYGIDTRKPGKDIENVVRKADPQMYSLKSLRKAKTDSVWGNRYGAVAKIKKSEGCRHERTQKRGDMKMAKNIPPTCYRQETSQEQTP